MKMKKEDLLNYESPSVEVIEVEVENGFEISSAGAEGFEGIEQL